jgi:hypothetical protein
MGAPEPKWSGTAAERQQRRNDLLDRLKREEVKPAPIVYNAAQFATTAPPAPPSLAGERLG